MRKLSSILMALFFLVVTTVFPGCGSKKQKSGNKVRVKQKVQKHAQPKKTMRAKIKSTQPEKEEESAVTITPSKKIQRKKSTLKKARESFLADIKQ